MAGVVKVALGLAGCVSLISYDNRKITVMIGTVLYVFGSCERHSNLTEEMYVPLRPISKKDFSSLMFL